MIEGIPEGWELVRVGKPIYNVDWVINVFGNPALCDFDTSYENKPIIRKIEKPKQYRPFANAAEAEPFWDRKLRYKGSDDCRLRVVTLKPIHCRVGDSTYTYREAFNLFECIDGTPFGIEVTE